VTDDTAREHRPGKPTSNEGDDPEIRIDYWLDHQKAADIVERLCAISTEIRNGLDRVTKWRRDQIARWHAAQAELERQAAAEKIGAADYDRQAKKLKNERAEIDRRAYAVEDIYALRALDALGIDRALLPGLQGMRRSFFDRPGAGVPLETLALRNRWALALSVMFEHGWGLDEAARQLARRHRRFTTSEIIEFRRDLRTGCYAAAAKTTQPQSFLRGAQKLTQAASRTGSVWDPGRPSTPNGLAELPTARAVAQREFDRLATVVEGYYAGKLDQGMTEREASSAAADWVIEVPELSIF